MAGRNAPPGDPPDGNRYPRWMLNEDEFGHTIALQMKVRPTEDSNQQTDTELRLPSDPFVIGSAVLLALGSNDARKVHASKEARGSKYILRTNSRSICEKLKQIKQLPDQTAVEIIEHPTLNTVHGVLYDPDTIDQPDNYILENLKDQGICGVRRIKKRQGDTLVNTPLLVISIKGTVLPQFIYFGLLRMKVRQYYPSPMLCYRCANYGHSKNRCDQTKNQPVCLNCSGTHELREQCKYAAFCKHCKSDHPPTSRECPVYREEEAIIRLKTNRGLTYAEARSEHREAHKGPSFSSIAKSSIRPDIDGKDRTIELLRKEIESLKEMISELKSAKGKKQHTPPQLHSLTTDDESIENTSISSIEPSSNNLSGSVTGSASVQKNLCISLEKINTRSTTKSIDNPIGNNYDKNYGDPTRANKRKDTERKKDGLPDSPERKKGSTHLDLNQVRKPKRK